MACDYQGGSGIKLSLVWIACLLFGVLASGQAAFRTIEGTVRDQSGVVVAGARVSLRSKTYERTARTSAEGNFKLEGVPAEAISLIVEASGFSPVERSVSAEQNRVEVVLDVPPVSQQVDVTANRYAVSLNKTAESVYILSRQAFEFTAGDPIDVGLRQVPGFTLFRRLDSREANPTSQGASLRGVGASGASRALVLYQGMPLNDPFGGWIYWGRVPSEAVGSVEVLRGGASSLYGGDAFSGVINILPPRPEQNFFSSEISLASQGTPDVSAFDSFQVGAWRLETSAETFRTGGYTLVPATQRGTVDVPANSFHQALQTALTRTLHSGDLWTSGAFYNETRDNGTQIQKNDTQLWQIIAGTDFLTPIGSLQLRGYGGGESFNQTFSSIAANRNSESLVIAQHVPSQNAGASLLWTRSLGKRNSLVAGADAGNVEGVSQDLNFAALRARSQVNSGGRQLSSGAFAQDMIHLTSRFLVTVGTRYSNWDNYDGQSRTVPLAAGVQPGLTHFVEQSQHAFTPRAAALFNANGHLALTASAYKAFRPPTLNELYRTFRMGNTLTLANSQLLAERLSGAEAGANLLFDRTRIHTAFFWMEVSDPIANVTLNTTPSLITRQRQNLGRTRSRGVELDAQWRVKNLDVRAGYQFVDAVVTAFPANTQLIGLEVPQVAPHQFTLQTSYLLRGWTMALLARASSSQFDDDLNRFSLDRYFQLDTYVSRHLRSNLEIFADVQNLTGSRVVTARTPLENIGPPIMGRVGFKMSLK
jgi:outer membrane receptor protein involved in Fe transport